MNLKNQPPVFVPERYQAEIEKLSKAALMDMIWDYAAQISGVDGGHPQAVEAVMTEFRSRRDIIQTHRDNRRNAWRAEEQRLRQ